MDGQDGTADTRVTHARDGLQDGEFTRQADNADEYFRSNRFTRQAHNGSPVFSDGSHLRLTNHARAVTLIAEAEAELEALEDLVSRESDGGYPLEYLLRAPGLKAQLALAHLALAGDLR